MNNSIKNTIDIIPYNEFTILIENIINNPVLDENNYFYHYIMNTTPTKDYAR